MLRLDIHLDRESDVPLCDQVAASLREQVRSGRLTAGTRLPPTRDLSRQLGIHRGTLQKAYETLVADGTLRARVGQGTFVNEIDPAAIGRDAAAAGADGIGAGTGRHARAAADPIAWSSLFAVEPRAVEDPTWDRIARWAGRPEMISFASGLPDAGLFPVDILRRCLDQALDEEGTTLLQYGSSRGHPPFLAALIAHLGRRGIPADGRRCLVVSGSQQGLDLIGRTLIAPGDSVVVEDPTYSGALALFRLLGARLLSVPMSGEGIDLRRLEALLARERPKLLYTIPTFHNPTGQTLPAARRPLLLDICAHAGVPVVEDDTDGELRFEGDDTPPLAAMPGAETVLYLGTFSKLFFPGLRLGWVVGPPAVIDRLEAAKRVTDLHTPPLLQAAMARFAASPGQARVAEQVRRRYRARRDALLAALESHMPDGVSWSRPEGGLSLMLTLPDGMDASELLPHAAEEGVLFAPGRLFSAEGRCASQLRLSFGNVDEERIVEGVTRLARAARREMDGGRRRATEREPVAAPPLV